jgi:LmbE family N-acetylglucosaminyl deacetylase
VNILGERALVLVAHPDDEVIGCGGTLARLAREGYAVTVAAMTDGVYARQVVLGSAARRWDQFLAVSRLLDFTPVAWKWHVPDNESDGVPRLELARCVEALLAEHRPDVVLTHSRCDLNVDHRRVHEAALVALRPVPGAPSRDLYCFEVPSSTEWGLEPFRPALHVDIGGEPLQLKLDAMDLYAEEVRTEPHPRSRRSLEALAAWRGACCGRQAAEAFEVVRMVR